MPQPPLLLAFGPTETAQPAFSGRRWGHDVTQGTFAREWQPGQTHAQRAQPIPDESVVQGEFHATGGGKGNVSAAMGIRQHFGMESRMGQGYRVAPAPVQNRHKYISHRSAFLLYFF